MPAEILQQQPGGFSLVRHPDGREEWTSPERAQEIVAESYPGSEMSFPPEQLNAPSPVPDVALPGPPGSEITMPPVEYSGEELEAAQPQPAEISFTPEQSVLPTAEATQAAAKQANPLVVNAGDKVNVRVSQPVERKGVTGYPESPDFSPFVAAQAQNAQELKGAIAASDAAQAEQDRVEQEGLYEEARQNKLAQFEHQQAMRDADASTAEYEARINEAVQQVPTVDPGRFWHQRSAFQAAAGMFAAAVGGWLQVMKGGPNYAIEQFNKLVDQDIRAQETDIETAREKVFRAERGYERNQARIETGFDRLEEQRIFRLSSIKAQVMADSLKYRSPIRQAETAKMLYALDNEIVKNAQSALQQHWTNEFNRIQQSNADKRAQQELSLGWYRAKTDRQQADQAGAGAPLDRSKILFDPLTREPILDPQGNVQVISTDAKDVRDFRIRQEGAKEIIEGIKELRELQRQAGKIVGGKWIFNSKVEHKAKALHTRIKLGMAKEASGLSYTDVQAKEIGEQMPLETLFVGDTDAVIQDRLEERIRNLDTMTKVAGLHWDVRSWAKNLGPQGTPTEGEDNSPTNLSSRLINTANTPANRLSEDEVGPAIQALENIRTRLKTGGMDSPGEFNNLQNAVNSGLRIHANLMAAGKKEQAFQVHNAIDKINEEVQRINAKRSAARDIPWSSGIPADIPAIEPPAQFNPLE